MAKTFVYRYSFKNKIYQISIGAYPEVTLDQAREKSDEYNAILNNEENRMMGIHEHLKKSHMSGFLFKIEAF